MKKTHLSGFFVLSFFILALVSVVMGIFLIFNMNDINVINEKNWQALQNSQLILGFNVENFHTQLEVWEYAYEPNDVRLVAFYIHDERLTVLANDLSDLVERDSKLKHGAGLAPQVGREINRVIQNLELVRTDWARLFEDVQVVRDMKEKGYNNVESENHPEYVVALEREVESVVANELLFDELDFNNQIDLLIKDQQNFLSDLHNQQELIISRFMILLSVLVTALVILTMLMAANFIYSRK